MYAPNYGVGAQQQQVYEEAPSMEKNLELANMILATLSSEDVITDPEILRMDSFYIEILQGLFDQDFGLQMGQNMQEMADNIEDLIDLLKSTSPDIKGLPFSGEGIVQGDVNQINIFLEVIASLIGLDEMEEFGEGEDPQNPDELEELADIQQKLMMENNENTVQGRGDGSGVIYGDPRDVRKARKQERLKKQEEEKAKSKGFIPQKQKI